MPLPIPPLLSPYLALPPEASLILLTSVLGTSTNWLVLRHMCNILRPPLDESLGQNTVKPKLIMVSLTTQLSFFEEGMKRLGFGSSTEAMQKRCLMIDGLTGIPRYVPIHNESASSDPNTIRHRQDFAWLMKQIKNGISSLRGSSSAENPEKIVLIIDQLDFLLACTNNPIDAEWLADALMELQDDRDVHSVILTINADQPLILEPTRSPLEIGHAAFLLTLVHQARMVMSTRLLDSGTASDVSGVLRITPGGGYDKDDGMGDTVLEKELLYHVLPDGNVAVFERGTGAV